MDALAAFGVADGGKVKRQAGKTDSYVENYRKPLAKERIGYEDLFCL